MNTQRLKQENEQSGPIGTAIKIFLVVGSPFHLIVGFSALTSFISEKSLAQFISEMTYPLEILLVLLIASLVIARLYAVRNSTC